jgi:2-oxoglutarate dehydrogenase E2 component (dihydrolipoamide succinyltransferase)
MKRLVIKRTESFMPVELKVPQVGESISEVQIADWLCSEGGRIERDKPVVSVESDKATVEVPSPVTGTLSKVLKQKGETASVGEVIALIEEDGGVPVKSSAKAAPPLPAEPAAKPKSAVSVEKPGVEKAPDKTSGGGMGAPSKAAPLEKLEPVVATKPSQTFESTAEGRDEETVKMTPMRRRIAERLVEAQHTAALLTTFNEVDMSAVISLREELRDAFIERYGVKLGFMSFFVKAVIDALKLVPQVNAEIRGDSIVYKNYYDIGIAVGGGKGLVVPVLRNADRLSFAEIEKAIAELAGRAKENKLKLEELYGGTFTISNGGIYGSMLSTPIINPPQSGILGLHAIQDRPVARDKQVVIRPMMYLALTYDHRIVDGREAVTFLKRIKDCIEKPQRMLLEV